MLQLFHNSIAKIRQKPHFAPCFLLHIRGKLCYNPICIDIDGESRVVSCARNPGEEGVEEA